MIAVNRLIPAFTVTALDGQTIAVATRDGKLTAARVQVSTNGMKPTQ